MVLLKLEVCLELLFILQIAYGRKSDGEVASTSERWGQMSQLEGSSSEIQGSKDSSLHVGCC